MMLVVVLVTIADHVVDHKWSYSSHLDYGHIYISKNTKFGAKFNDSGDHRIKYENNTDI